MDGHYETTGGGSYTPDPGLDGSLTPPNYLVDSGWGTDPSANHSGYVGPSKAQIAAGLPENCGNSGFDDGVCAYGQPALAATGSAPIFGTASVGSERAQGFRQVDSALEKTWNLHDSHALLFKPNACKVGKIVSYNNEGRTTGAAAHGAMSRVPVPNPSVST